MKRIFLIIGSLLVCFLAIIVWMTIPQSKGQQSVAVKFLGFTNDAAGTRMATCTLSNGSPWAVSFRYMFQLFTGKGWTNSNGGRFLSGDTLPAGASELLILPAPTNQIPWRILFSATKPRNALLKISEQLLMEAQRRGFPTKYERASRTSITWTETFPE
ncbi:MAG: hypothetical protein JWM68_1958 [Verrucomicrobiales bacterium]|nr:hypothetical protein [Verrucomicrobiales bacterium]